MPPSAVGLVVNDLLHPELFAEIPGTGHCPYLEADTEFNRIVIEFLDRRAVRGLSLFPCDAPVM